MADSQLKNNDMALKSTPADVVATIVKKRPELSRKHDLIAAYVLENSRAFIRCTSREICAELNTSEPTLIKFCQLFGYSGLSAFRIDLALALASPERGSGFVEPLANDRRQVNLVAKQHIARRAAQLVADDQSLLIDNGSTAEIFAMVLDEVPAKTIMTTGLLVAQNAMAHGQHTVMLTGGRIRPNALSMAGRMVESNIKTMNFDTFVMSADSIDPVTGLSSFHEDEANNTRCMVDSARRVIVLADLTKISKPSLYNICGLDRVDILVTDLPTDNPAFAIFEANDVSVISVAKDMPPLREKNDAAA